MHIEIRFTPTLRVILEKQRLCWSLVSTSTITEIFPVTYCHFPQYPMDSYCFSHKSNILFNNKVQWKFNQKYQYLIISIYIIISRCNLLKKFFFSIISHYVVYSTNTCDWSQDNHAGSSNTIANSQHCTLYHPLNQISTHVRLLLARERSKAFTDRKSERGFATRV